MSRLIAAVPGGLRVILCLKFANSAPFNAVAQLKRALIDDERVVHSVDVSGSYDFMAEVQLSDLTAYQAMLDHFAAEYGHLIEHYEASFICRRYVRERDRPSAHFWVPTAFGLQRVEHDRINMVTAEGDYVRVHVDSGSWLVHATMKSTLGRLDSHRFVRINRSTIVRIDFIERLIHYYRRWVVRLFDQSEHSIAKSRTARVLAELRADSSIMIDTRSNPERLNDEDVKATENPLH